MKNVGQVRTEGITKSACVYVPLCELSSPVLRHQKDIDPLIDSVSRDGVMDHAISGLRYTVNSILRLQVVV